MKINTIQNADCLTGLRAMPDNSVNCCVTSPPYFGLRDYGHDGQIGLEETPDAYVAKVVEVFREVRRVLRDDGTCWLNLGDSYAGSSNTGGTKSIQGTAKRIGAMNRHNRKPTDGLKPKDLIGIPWMVAFALRADGWYLRQDIIWHKPNPMPESVTDRCTKAHEYIFLLTKSERYWYDANAIKDSGKDPGDDLRRQMASKQEHKSSPDEKRNGIRPRPFGKAGGNRNSDEGRVYEGNADGMANKRSVWSVTTKPFSEAHFATFPEDLIVPCILAGCPEGGLVLDPFMGSGTTAFVASKLGRNYYGFEINPEYIEIQKRRLHKELGMFSPNYLAPETLEK